MSCSLEKLTLNITVTILNVCIKSGVLKMFSLNMEISKQLRLSLSLHLYLFVLFFLPTSSILLAWGQKFNACALRSAAYSTGRGSDESRMSLVF